MRFYNANSVFCEVLNHVWSHKSGGPVYRDLKGCGERVVSEGGKGGGG